MLAIEILRSFNAHTELANYDYECDSTPGSRAVQYQRKRFSEYHCFTDVKRWIYSYVYN